MSSSWRDTTVGECLQDEFPGDWGEGPERGWNALVLRSTNLDDDGHVNVSTAAPRKIAPSKLSAKALRPGDILLEASGGGPGKPVGRVAGFNGPSSKFIVSNFFRTLRPNSSVSAEFLAWRLQHLYAQPEIWRYQQQTTGIINLKVKEYLEHTIMLPPAREQRRIAEILDTVDEAIRSTEAVIRKLEQVKRGLLHDLLTRGIDDNGELRDPERHPEQFKDSPLGRIPREWEVEAIRDLLAGHFAGEWGATPGDLGANVRALRSTNIDDDGHVDLSSGAPRVLSQSKLRQKRLLSGDILLEASGGGPGKPVGRVALFEDDHNGPYVCSNLFRTLRPTTHARSHYLAWRLLYLYRQPTIWQFQQQTTGIINLKYRDYLDHQIAMAPLHEQDGVVAVLASHERKEADECDLASKLRRLKTGLMDDLLTGRVRVTP